jgi:hypothetical protein
MATDRIAVLAAINAQRESNVPLGEGKSVTIRRPPEGIVWQYRGLIDLKAVCECAVAWSGFRECDVIEGGADDALDFHPDVFRAVIEDRNDWLDTLVKAIAKAIEDHAAKRKAAQGNSPPASP